MTDLDPPPPVAGDEDEVSDEDINRMAEWMPEKAAQAVKAILFRARRVVVAIRDAHALIADLTTAVGQLNTARINHNNRLNDLTTRVQALEASVNALRK